mmetsp:Transcript_38129/g.64926  ORF Transcript_38129/g.64926 Transcript_38129/m.64926 type:complete len:283 (-) Transcript_38129:189-1037(-)
MVDTSYFITYLVLAACVDTAATFQFVSSSSTWHSKRPRRNAAKASAEINKIVALTREFGKNDKLAALLAAQGVPTVEIPCIEHGVGVDREALPGALGQPWGYVVCTSPEAAQVLLEGWIEAGKPESLWKVASVGAATSATLQSGGLCPDFEPTKATAATLAKELPERIPMTVLYPASSLAASTLQEGLAARGFEPFRLDTYTTRPATWDAGALAAARASGVVTFASPSAVKVWTERVGTDTPAACIGETSAAASEKAGFSCVEFPEKPGMDGWATSVLALVR